jgi:hypothetical protein
MLLVPSVATPAALTDKHDTADRTLHSLDLVRTFQLACWNEFFIKTLLIFHAALI